MSTIHFIAGLPRSGSTLLCNLLAQNPRFHATATSGVLDVVVGVRNTWNQVESFRASPNPVAKENVLRAILKGFFDDVDKPVIFDKSRGWPTYFELANKLLERPAKIIVPVRDTRDVIASFENIYRKHAALDPLPQEKQNPALWTTIEGRVQAWVESSAPVGSAFNRIRDAIQRGFADQMLFVEFERLTGNPSEVMKSIYEFLGEEAFDHNFNNVEQLTVEDDTEFGFPAESLHTIRPKIEPVAPRWPQMLTKELAAGLEPHNKVWTESSVKRA